jgi:hypothetical protein
MTRPAIRLGKLTGGFFGTMFTERAGMRQVSRQ